ncbi:MAG: family metallopeptidase [Chitinophagaceae bacterium]|nr:family metallopeptidase [Chitinophagaceae bacterium]
MKLQVHAKTMSAALLFSTIALAGPGDKLPKEPVKYIDKSNMDLSVKPGDNFYLYANGNWIKKHPVPASKTRWGSFDMLREESSKRMQNLLEDAAAHTSKGRSTQMIGDLYASGMDSATIEARGYLPIKSDLDRVTAITNLPDLLTQIAVMRTQGAGSALISVGIQPDRKNVTHYIPSIGQGGTSLPDRDYYINNDPRSVKIRQAYTQHLQNMFGLVGQDAATASRNADAVLRIETALAKAQYSRVEQRDPYKTYNKYAIKDLGALSQNVNWFDLLNKMKIHNADSIIVSNPSFLKTLDGMLTSVPINDWKAYVQWNIIRNAAPNLSSAFVNEDFRLTQALTGQKEQTPRWQRMSGLIDRSLSDLLGQLYVEKYFKPAAKQRMLELVNNMTSTFASRINKLDWMSDETKQRALEKLSAIKRKIAYPDKWRDYQGINISRENYFENLRNISVWGYDFSVNRLGKPVDRTEWGMTPPTINASYNPSANDITFPAGILQAPFFDFGADDAINYGGIAAVIGHEMTHGFDDQGSQFAADGNLKNWWAPSDSAQFRSRTQKVVDQYNNFTVLDTIHVNGKLTLGENLADLGGLNIAYEAFTHTKQFKEGKKIDGFTPTQRFFLNWAQVWRSNTVDETAAQLIKTDPHSPGMYRANGPVANMDQWYQAFNVKPGDRMYKAPEQRIHIW